MLQSAVRIATVRSLFATVTEILPFTRNHCGALKLIAPCEKTGRSIVGVVQNTALHVPVSSVRTLASCAEVVAENCPSQAFVSALSMFRLVKFVFITERDAVSVSVQRSVVSVLIL